MKLSRLVIGGHTELVRPVHKADERLMRRIDEARRRLGDVQVKPVRITGQSVREHDVPLQTRGRFKVSVAVVRR